MARVKKLQIAQASGLLIKQMLKNIFKGQLCHKA